MVVATLFVWWTTLLPHAPCTWRQPTLATQAHDVVAAIAAHKARSGRLPPRRPDGMPDAEGIPHDYAGEYIIDRDQFTLKYMGAWTEGTIGFDGPWVRYTSADRRLECFAR